MLETLEVINFQSHIKSKVNFVAGINIFTGPSDAGKTSFTSRAFNLLRKNRPLGMPFSPRKPNNTIDLSIVAATLDGITATHIKSKSINQYTLSTNKEPFDVVGTDVPTEISDFLNISDNSIQEQHADYFLLQDTPGVVAKKLNKIADLEIIDFVTKEVNSAITENTKDISHTEKKIEELDADIAKYAHLDDVENILSGLSSKIKDHNKKLEIKNGIEATISTIVKNRRRNKYYWRVACNRGRSYSDI